MRKLVKQNTMNINLPFMKRDTFKFQSIIVNKKKGALITGMTGGKYASETTDIYCWFDGEVRVLGAHDFDMTNQCDLDMIRDFVDFVVDNIDIEYYESKPTNTGIVMMTLEDCKKIRDWSDTHKFDESVIFDKILNG
jgi:hypothetical protein